MLCIERQVASGLDFSEARPRAGCNGQCIHTVARLLVQKNIALADFREGIAVFRQGNGYIRLRALNPRRDDRIASLENQIFADQVRGLGRISVDDDVGKGISRSRQDIDHRSKRQSIAFAGPIDLCGGARLVPAFRGKDTLHQGAVFRQPGGDLCDIRRFAIPVFQRGKAIELVAQAGGRLFVCSVEAVDADGIGDLRGFGIGCVLCKLDRLHVELIQRGKGGGQFGIANGRIADFFHCIPIGEGWVAKRGVLTLGRSSASLFLGNSPFEVFDRFQRRVQGGIVRRVEFGDGFVELLLADDRFDLRKVRIGGRGRNVEFACLADRGIGALRHCRNRNQRHRQGHSR